MKLYGSLSRLVSILFRKDSNDITVRPNQATTYSAGRDVQLPPGDADHVLTSADSTQTLTGKTISGASNTISNVSLTTGVTGTLPVGNGGTNSTTALSNNRVMKSSGGAIVEAAAITASRALQSDANGIPTHSAVTSTELGYLSGVTSSIQAQLDAGTIHTFHANWITADGTSKTVTHNLGTLDVQVELYDKTDGQTIWVDSVVRTDTNTLTLTSSEAPGAAGWRVVVHAS